MGLYISHDAWHGAYSAFSRWRNQLAECAGYWVLPVGFDDPFPNGFHSTRPTVLIDWGHLPVPDPDALHGEWLTEPDDPLLYVIAHSDCDGQLSPARCLRLADRIEELLPLLPSEPAPGHIGDWRAKTMKFIDGARKAALAGEPLEFW